jgi:hypothetical protein
MRQGGHDGVQEIIQREIVGQFCKKEQDNERPSDNSCVFLMATGDQEGKKSNTGYQHQILDHYSYIHPIPKKGF